MASRVKTTLLPKKALTPLIEEFEVPDEWVCAHAFPAGNAVSSPLLTISNSQLEHLPEEQAFNMLLFGHLEDLDSHPLLVTQIVSQLHRLGIGVVSLEEGIDTSTRSGHETFIETYKRRGKIDYLAMMPAVWPLFFDYAHPPATSPHCIHCRD
ncbi:MAG: hypothetical protein AAF799_00740 [Myxococcota bacterium]